MADSKGWAKGRRVKHLYWTYNDDGRLPREQLNSDIRKYWRRWARRIRQEITDEAIEDWEGNREGAERGSTLGERGN